MRRFLCTILFVTIAAAADGCPTGWIATEFADAYAAFAPIYALHAAYADVLFSGTNLAVPPDLAGACDAFSIEVARLHLALLTQTGSIVVPVPRAMVRLRAGADAFCEEYGTVLREIGSTPSPDLGRIEEASDAGLFAEISAVNGVLEEAFTAFYEAIDDEEARWRFAVAFVTRGLVHRDSASRIDANLLEIFYGSADRASPPFSVSEDVSAAMASLIEYAGRALTPAEWCEVQTLSSRIHEALITGQSP